MSSATDFKRPTWYPRYVKRPLDLCLASLLLVALAPLAALVALAIIVFLGRPILFIDRRAGRRGRPFGCLKFRTMSNARDDAGRLLPDEQRRTRLGDWLRATSLDELPQLWNVLRGEMSLIGPRPLAVRYLDRYTPRQARRHEVRPGITGWAQVHGRKSLAWERRFELDVWYVERVSPWLDAKILLATLWLFLAAPTARAGASSPDQEFRGSQSRPS